MLRTTLATTDNRGVREDYGGLQQATDNRRIAVLPLANISLDAKDEIVSDGVTEELISTLTKIAGLWRQRPVIHLA